MELTYVGTHPRTYLFPGHAPVEAQPDGTYTVPYDPGDGHWQPTAEPDAPAPKRSAKAAPDITKEA